MEKEAQERGSVDNELSVESLFALERQCNKLCIKKMVRAFTVMRSAIDKPPQPQSSASE